MRFSTKTLYTTLAILSATWATPSLAEELRRADLSGAPGMEVVLSINHLNPGETLPLHFHHGVEAAYIIDGAMIKPQGKPAIELAPGASLINLRDIAHGGFEVVGEKTLKYVSVHVVDKGKPLYEWIEK